jgi:UDP-galactopyranose mutase
METRVLLKKTMNRITTDILVVGSGFAGCTVAERLASSGRKVLVIEKRSHVGGNCYDEHDDHGVLIHRYGPHIFHTQMQHVVDYLSRFTEWHPYEHRVLAHIDGHLYPFPINLDTINYIFDMDLDETGAELFLKRIRAKRYPVKTSEDVVLNSVGDRLCDKFYRNYTRKQWGLDLSQLDAGVASRIPVRTSRDDRYFSDPFQAIPSVGFTAMFNRILDHPNIRLELSADFFNVKEQIKAYHTIFTGPIDAYFQYCIGKLSYRSIRFEHQHFTTVKHFQPVAVVNYPNDYDFTRITEFKHVTGQDHDGTSIVLEYPGSTGVPCYPIPRDETKQLAEAYKQLAKKEQNVTFLGRLAEYRYYNMDQVVDVALKTAENIIAASYNRSAF